MAVLTQSVDAASGRYVAGMRALLRAWWDDLRTGLADLRAHVRATIDGSRTDDEDDRYQW